VLGALNKPEEQLAVTPRKSSAMTRPTNIGARSIDVFMSTNP
jgi:hypothetical protein